MDFLDTTIKEVTVPGPGYAYLRFAGERPIAGDPGQFVMVRGDFGDDPILPRAFSLVASGDTGAILVRDVGKATGLLVRLKLGDRLRVLGPLGNRFAAPAPDATPVLVAGGVGVAPLIFLAERLARQGIRPTFVYGGRTSDDLLLLDRIARAADLLLTSEDGSKGEKGLVTAPVKRLLETKSRVKMFSCGPDPMLRALAQIAREARVSLEVALEQAMACGMGTCKGCAVHAPKGGFKYVCSDGPVFDAREIFGGAL